MTNKINNLNIIVLRSKLQEAFLSIEKSVGRDTVSLPILKNVLICAESGKITFITTNLELVIKHTINGKILEEGSFTVPFIVLNNVVKNLTSERITLEQNANELKIITDNYEAVINGQSSQDFPIIPDIKQESDFIKCSSGFLKDILSNVSVAMQYSDIRPEISGVCVFVDEHQLSFVATDSFRLVERVISGESFESNIKIKSFIIPFKTVGTLLRVLLEDEEDLKILIDSNQIIFQTNTITVISRLIDGTFPDYKQVMPKSFASEISIARQEFINAVKTVSSFSGRARDMIIKVGSNKKFLEISSRDSTIGESVYKLPLKTECDFFTIVFNWQYIFDGLKIYKSEDIILGVNGSDKPAVIKSISESFLVYVVMPIKN